MVSRFPESKAVAASIWIQDTSHVKPTLDQRQRAQSVGGPTSALQLLTSEEKNSLYAKFYSQLYPGNSLTLRAFTLAKITRGMSQGHR